MYARFIPILAAAALLAACGAEDDIALDLELGAATLEHGPGLDPEVAAVAEEAWLLHEELAARLEERGVTLEELWAAVEDEDEDAILEMFGYTPEEADAVYRRFVAVVERGEASMDPGDGAADPQGWPSCNWPAVGLCIYWSGRSLLWSPVKHPVVLGLLAAGDIVGCGYVRCSFDRTDPGPSPREK